jgi:O-phospho-L-seryl-tRNASec:L-selenocysteinyl-tRNA synthase
MDSNNFLGSVGAGEREGRVYSRLVHARHYGLSHGVGRSGDIAAVQPKAAGSSLIYKLTNRLALDAIHLCGISRAHSALVLPTATGMSMTLVLLALAARRRQAGDAGPWYVVWPRIDQKSCFKAILAAGCIPVIVNPKLARKPHWKQAAAAAAGSAEGSGSGAPAEGERAEEEGDELVTDVDAVSAALSRLGPRVLCVLSTTSCFAPRGPDDVVRLARLCAAAGVAHVLNHAYGLQASKLCALVDEAIRVGRLDAWVQSTDKNFLVPVGGAIVAAPKPAAPHRRQPVSASTSPPGGTGAGAGPAAPSSLVDEVARLYPGRASVGPVLDLFVTLLSMGRLGLRTLLAQRKAAAAALRLGLAEVAARHGERVLQCDANPISCALSLSHAAAEPGEACTYLGSMLFSRGISGTRVVSARGTKTIDGFRFVGFGAQCDAYPTAYLTAAAALGMTEADVALYCSRLDATIREFKAQAATRKPQDK